MTKMIVFDMDGTIADLYGVDGWLECLKNENPLPYEIAKPLYDMDILIDLLNELKLCGWKIAVTTWLSKGGTPWYNKEVRRAKKEWLDKFNFPYDELHMVKYGSTKANHTRNKADFQILVDDNKKVRDGWNLGDTIDANLDIIEKLAMLLLTE